MKKLIALLLVIAMVGCLFAACASDGNNDTQPATDAPTESNDNNSDNTDNTDNTDNNESGKTYKITRSSMSLRLRLPISGARSRPASSRP